MRRRYQEGGGVLADDLDDPEVGGGQGALDPATMLMSVFAQQYTTTPEAQKQAREILDRVLSQDTTAWDKILQGKRDQAEHVRTALQTARQRLLDQNYNPGELLLAIGQGLGQPTRSGAIGETAGNVAAAAREPIANRNEWQRGRDTALSQLDLAEANVGQDVTNSEFELNKLREQIMGRLGVEAMNTLGKTATGAGMWKGPVPKSMEALDENYVKEYYLPWKAGGNERAAAGLDRLRFVADVLKRGSDALTGPYIGAVSSVPWVGRWLQGYASPSSLNLRDLVERTIQEDLRPTLGSQFTEREGENLIARSFNVNLEERRNAPRIDQLISQMESIYKNQADMADYFDANQTLYRFPKPTMRYSSGDFKFDDEDDDQGGSRTDQLSPEARRSLQPGSGLFLDPSQLRAKGGQVRRRYQEGGPVLALAPEAETTLEDDLKSIWEQYGDPVGMGVGAAVGLGANALTDTLAERGVAGTSRRVADAITSGGLDPVAVAEDIKRNRRAGVPDTLMDTDTAGIRALTEQAFRFGDAPAEEALRNLRTRLEGSRERVNQRVETALKPYDYFEYDMRLSNRLANERTAEMKTVFDKYPAVPVDPVLSEIMNTPEGKRAVEWAFRFYDNAPGRTPGQTDRKGILTKPSMEFYDYVRKGFNQTITREERAGETDFGEVLRDLKKTYLDRLDQIAPEYRVAREAQGDDLEIRDSLASGRKFMRLQPEQLAEMAKNQNFHQRNAYRTGMAQSIFETMDRASAENFNAAQRIAGSPALMARIEPFLDNPQQYKIFQTALEREAELFRTGRQTLKAGERARTAREATRQTKVRYAVSKLGGLRYAVSALGWTLRLFNDMPKMSPNEADKVLSVLRRGTPAEMNAFATKIKRLRTLRSSRNPRRAAAAAIGAGVGMMLGDDDEPQE